jgi:hypothetical protein
MMWFSEPQVQGRLLCTRRLRTAYANLGMESFCKLPLAINPEISCILIHTIISVIHTTSIYLGMYRVLEIYFTSTWQRMHEIYPWLADE